MSTLVTLEANVGKPLGLDYIGADKAELDVKLNDAVVDMLRRTRCYVAPTTIPLTAGTTDYTLSTDILSIRTIYVTGTDSQSGRFVQLGEQEITDLQTTQAATGSPVTYYALIGSNLLTVWPAPSAADTITIRHVPRPTAMSSPTHDPSNATYGGIPAEYHPGLELYALWKMGDSSDDSTSGQGERYRIQYEGDNTRGGYLATMRAELYRKGGGALPRARFPRGRRNRGIGLRNDQRY